MGLGGVRWAAGRVLMDRVGACPGGRGPMSGGAGSDGEGRGQMGGGAVPDGQVQSVSW